MLARIITLWILLMSGLAMGQPARSPGGPSANQMTSSTPSAASDGYGRSLVIGVRIDASPFSYQLDSNAKRGLAAKSGPIRMDGFDGYMAYICDEILKQMLLPEAQPPITPKQILVKSVDELLAEAGADATTDRFTLLEQGKIDILCDPATISRDRVRSFAVSPPLFLTGISYLIREGTMAPLKACARPAKALIGAVGTTNAINHGVNAIIAAGEWPELRGDIVSALRNQDKQGSDGPCPMTLEPGASKQIIWPAANHEELAKAFCNGEVTYYVGDFEIIRAAVARIPGCAVTSGIQRYTADRYAIFGNIDYAAADPWKALIIGRFFELLNREVVASDSVLDQAYSATWGDSEQSEALKLFYWNIRGLP